MKKFSTKILVIGLVILIVIFVVSRFYRSPRLENSIKKELVKLDTAAISEVRILPSKDHVEEVKLLRMGKTWKVKKGQRVEASSHAAIKNMLEVLVDLEAQRLASRKKEKWAELNVGENSTHVTVYEDGKAVADFHVGKLGFTQSPGGGFGGGTYTYVRRSDENEVYIVDGFLEAIFNNSFNDWRDKTFLKFNKKDLTKISFRYPLDSGFLLEKRDSVWYEGTEKTDPAKTEGFVNTISTKYLTEFVDGFTSTQTPDAVIEMSGKAGNLLTIEAWKKDGKDWIFSSSVQKGVCFSNKGSNIVADLLIGKKKLLPR